MTKLEAVNQILRGVGYSGVSALDTDGNSEAAQAERVLDEVELEVQSRGWYYNQVWDVDLTPDGSDNIVLPSGTIVIDSYGEDSWRQVTQQGGKLYDLDNNTDEFTGNLRVTYIKRFDFDCIPQPVQKYIVCKAACSFNDSYGKKERAQKLYMAEQQAYGLANHFNGRVADVNLVKSNEAEMIRGRRRRWSW